MVFKLMSVSPESTEPVKILGRGSLEMRNIKAFSPMRDHCTDPSRGLG